MQELQELQGRTIDYSGGYIYIVVFKYISHKYWASDRQLTKKNSNKMSSSGEVLKSAIRCYLQGRTIDYPGGQTYNQEKVSSRKICFSARYRARAVSSIYFSIPGGPRPQYAIWTNTFFQFIQIHFLIWKNINTQPSHQSITLFQIKVQLL